MQKGWKVIFKLYIQWTIKMLPIPVFNSNFITKLFQFLIGSKPTQGVMWKLLDWLIGSDDRDDIKIEFLKIFCTL